MHALNTQAAIIPLRLFPLDIFVSEIIATLGPAIYNETKLKQLVKLGVDAFRINFSHETKNISSIPTYNASTQNASRSAGFRTKTIRDGHTEIWEAVRTVPAESSNGQYNPTTSKAYWKRLDVCGKTLQSCKCRFGFKPNDLTGASKKPDGSKNLAARLPFGSFPGTLKF